MYRILVVDDDREILKLMRNILELQDYQVTTMQEEARPIVLKDFTGFDLILLDVMMPGMDGMELCRQIRERVKSPILFVSAKDREEDIVRGLELGGDDYITKPFSVKQLQARVAAHLKREERQRYAVEEFHSVRRMFGRVLLDLPSRKVLVDQQPLALTYREYDFLDLLSSYPTKVFTREEIYERIYSEDADALFHSISEYVYQIRVKFAAFDINPIKTVRGVGYQWAL